MPFEELKQRQSVVWGAGPYEPIVRITDDLHHALVEALQPEPGERFLDVATGTGAVAVLAALSGATVTGLDLAPTLIERAKAKADIEGLDIAFDVGDAEALPYEDRSFDIVCSAIGTQFAPDHEAVARELARVCRAGGRLGLACWTPSSGFAELFDVMRPFAPQAEDGVGDIFDWGRPEHVEELLGDDFDLTIEERDTPLPAASGEAVWARYVTAYGPTKSVVESLEPDRLAELHRAWVAKVEASRARHRDRPVARRTC